MGFPVDFVKFDRLRDPNVSSPHENEPSGEKPIRGKNHEAQKPQGEKPPARKNHKGKKPEGEKTLKGKKQ